MLEKFAHGLRGNGHVHLVEVYFILNAPVAASESGEQPALQSGPKVADLLACFDLAEIYRAMGQLVEYGLFVLLSLHGNRLGRVRAAVVPVTSDPFDLSDLGTEKSSFIVSNAHRLRLLRCCLRGPIQL